MPMPANVPFYIKYLSFINLLICTVHLALKVLMFVHLAIYVKINDTNTHFALTCVVFGLLVLLICSTIIDLFSRMFYTFRYVIGLNIALVGSLLFVAGYLLGHFLEIKFAGLYPHPCRTLGIDINVNLTEIQSSVNDNMGDLKEFSCENAISRENWNIFLDLLLIVFFLPLHLFSTAFSFTFSGLYRSRGLGEAFN